MNAMVEITMPAADFPLTTTKRHASRQTLAKEPKERSFTLRAQQFTGPEPRAGDFLLSRSTETAWRILGVTTQRIAGAKLGTHKLRLTCRVVVEADMPIPETARVHQWPVAKQTAKPPQQRPSADPGPTETARERIARIRAKAPLLLAEAGANPVKDLRTQTRIEQAERMSRWHDGDPVIPAARLEPVKHGKHKLRGPTAVPSSWRDPDDVNPNRRKPREIRGHRSFDQIRTRHRQNPNAFKREHVIAADMYRLAWEIGPGQARPGYERPMMPAQGFGPGSGPDDARLAGMAAWGRVQAYIGDERALRALDLVVLRHGDLTALSRIVGLDRREVVGYLVGILDRLLTYYGEEVATVLRQEDPD